MEVQVQGQGQVQRRSAQDLREIRNSYIQQYAKQEFSIKTLAYLFGLSESTIRQVTQGITLGEKKASIEQLEAAREKLRDSLTQHGYTIAEIEFILGKSSLAQAETIRKLQEEVNRYKGLEFSHQTQIESLKQAHKAELEELQRFHRIDVNALNKLLKEKENANKSLGEKVKQFDADNGKLASKVKHYEGVMKEFTDKVNRLEKEKENLNKSNGSLSLENARLKRDIEGLTDKAQSLEQDKGSLTENNESLYYQVLELTGANKELKQDNKKLTQTNQDLSLEITRLKNTIESLTGNSQSLEQEKASISDKYNALAKKVQEEIRPAMEDMNDANKKLVGQIESLQEELAQERELSKQEQDRNGSLLEKLSELRAELQNKETDIADLQTQLEAKDLEVVDTVNETDNYSNSIAKRFTKVEKQKMVDFYKANKYVLTADKLNEFRQSTGIEVTDMGFRKVCKEYGVYKNRQQKAKEHKRKEARKKRGKK